MKSRGGYRGPAFVSGPVALEHPAGRDPARVVELRRVEHAGTGADPEQDAIEPSGFAHREHDALAAAGQVVDRLGEHDGAAVNLGIEAGLARELGQAIEREVDLDRARARSPAGTSTLSPRESSCAWTRMGEPFSSRKAADGDQRASRSSERAARRRAAISRYRAPSSRKTSIAIESKYTAPSPVTVAQALAPKISAY